MPDSVLHRDSHSMNVVATSASCLWLLVIGGYKSEPIDGFKGASECFASPKFAQIEMSE